MSRIKFTFKPREKKTAEELLKEIPDTPEQRKINREIAKIERDYIIINNKKSSKQPIKVKIDKKPYSSKKKIISTRNKTRRKNVRIDNKFVENSGYYAGKIWTAISNYGPLNQTLVIEKTKLSLNDFYIGMGWLARENKIYRDNNYYYLGETNLTFEIGDNAGKIWKLLDSQEQVDLTLIQKLTNMNLKDTYSALGWLCCENKIKTYYRNNKMIFELT